MKDIVKFRALLGIAKADGDFDEAEKKFISHLAELEGMTLEELDKFLESGDKTENIAQSLSFDDKIEILIYSVKLMKIDGKVLLSEIKFCEKVAEILGFEEKAIGFLASVIQSNPDMTSDMGRINHRMRNYLK